ncbi:MAG: endonuclease domain-containing protein [Adhaeribacter sp.]
MEDNLHKGAAKKLFDFARENRKKQTAAEELLWQHLRNRQLNNLKFRRQHPLGNFIADFYLHEAKLVIELDGEYHNAAENQDYDAGRTYELEEMGIKVLRFTNEEVLNDLDKVILTIKKHLILNSSPGRKPDEG